jgi:hypothetical protein
MSAVLAYVSAVMVAVWGVLHAVPTRQVLAGFEPVTADNRRVIKQEWLAEAFTMWGIAVVVIAATAAGGTAPDVRAWVYRAAVLLLVALAVLTALTGARTRVIWFKICPVLLSVAAVLLLAASFR